MHAIDPAGCNTKHPLQNFTKIIVFLTSKSDTPVTQDDMILATSKLIVAHFFTANSKITNFFFKLCKKPTKEGKGRGRQMTQKSHG